MTTRNSPIPWRYILAGILLAILTVLPVWILIWKEQHSMTKRRALTILIQHASENIRGSGYFH